MSDDSESGLFDIAIVGGGIQGAGIAQAAAAAGYRTLLIEKTGWAAGTSSKSSKLIHGGLRYLESGEFSLVRESLRERELLLQLAPELVTRQHFQIPVYRASRLSGWQLSIGLSLYSLLAGFGQHTRFQRLKRPQWAAFPELRTEGLTAVYRYCDAQTDDQALTEAVVQSAQALGTTLACPAEFISAQQSGIGYQLRVKTDHGLKGFDCHCLINAGGPWINYLAQTINPEPPMLQIDLVQGTHLFFSKPLSRHCFYLQAPQDGRAVFVLPWKKGTLVGTTETLFTGHPDQCRPLPQEAEYLMAVVRHYFPNCQSHPDRQFSGLRVLPESDKNLFARSREVQLAVDGQYLAVYGGKLTGYRATADKVIKRVATIIGPRTRIADTAELPLKP